MLVIFVFVIAFIFIIRLYNLQIVNGDMYRNQAEKRLVRTTYSYAPRGNIYDRNGVLLATSDIEYNLEIYRTKRTTEELNKLLLNIASVLKKHGDSFYSSFPIDLETMTYTKGETAINSFKNNNNIKKDATIEEIVNIFTEKYNLQSFDDFDKRYILPLRYEVATSGYTSYRATTIAKNISKESLLEFKEQYMDFAGVYIVAKPNRKYLCGNTLSHVIGYVGMIDQQEYENKKDDGYTINDIVGKSGVESSFEEFLRGKNGTKRIEIDSKGIVTSEDEITQSVMGDDLYLTIDIELQKKTEEALEKIIREIQNGEINKLKFSDATCGSAVVMNVKTGEILSTASYPSYDPQDFVDGINTEEYDKYFNNKDRPLYNRVIQGVYPPGSTFKMVTGIAGIESGVIGVNDTVNDTGVFYLGHKPACWLWNSRRQVHGRVNAMTALKVSCNYYYYEIGSRMGIDKIADYAKKFGFGKKTGIELYGESQGIVASKEYVASQNEKGAKLTWSIGDTLSASIGQSYTVVTPIQMVNYISTIANKGKKVDLTILQKLIDCEGNEKNKSDIKRIIDKNIGVSDYVNEDIDLSDETVNAIFEGMRSVTGDQGGTVYGTFNSFPIEVAGKTGTATSGNGSDNAWFVGFAPYDDPEIAVVVMVEHGGHGYFTARAVKDIMEVYFDFNNADNVN